MYGKHRTILRSDKRVIVAGKHTPDSQGGSYHPLGFWELRDDGQYIAHVRSPEQWDSMVTKAELGMHLTAPTQKALRQAVLDYYDQTRQARREQTR